MRGDEECKFGHRWTLETTGIDKRGDRYCKVCKKLGTQAWRARQDPEILRAKDRNQQHQYNRKLREAALVAYGGRCKCCGESEPHFLHLDHVNNDGNVHRRELIGKNSGSASTRIMAWAKRNNWPDRLQLLCYNCGMSKAFYGVCPHEGC